MKPTRETECTAFFGTQKIARGNIVDVIPAVKAFFEKSGENPVLLFDNTTSAPIEIDFRGSTEEILSNISSVSEDSEKKPLNPGRPKLGVISREISLLPRHWEWLSLQQKGASATIRTLVEEAKKKTAPQDEIQKAQNSLHTFMTAIAGNMPGYEEALRALYSGEKKRFSEVISAWTKDVREHTEELAKKAFLE